MTASERVEVAEYLQVAICHLRLMAAERDRAPQTIALLHRLADRAETLQQKVSAS